MVSKFLPKSDIPEDDINQQPNQVVVSKVREDYEKMLRNIEEMQNGIYDGADSLKGLVRDGEIGISVRSASDNGLYDSLKGSYCKDLIKIMLEPSESRVVSFQSWLNGSGGNLMTNNFPRTRLGTIDYESALPVVIDDMYSEVLLNINSESVEGIELKKQLERERVVREEKHQSYLKEYRLIAGQRRFSDVVKYQSEKTPIQQRSVLNKFTWFEKILAQNKLSNVDKLPMTSGLFYAVFCRLPNDRESQLLDDNQETRFGLFEYFASMNEIQSKDAEDIWNEFFQKTSYGGDRQIDINLPSNLDFQDLNAQINIPEDKLIDLKQSFDELIIPSSFENTLNAMTVEFIQKMQLEKLTSGKTLYDCLEFFGGEQCKEEVRYLRYFLQRLYAKNQDSVLFKIHKSDGDKVWVDINEYFIESLFAQKMDNQPPKFSEYFAKLIKEFSS